MAIVKLFVVVVEYLSPVAPVDPVLPVAPVAPVTPVAPVIPVMPVKPVGPTSPYKFIDHGENVPVPVTEVIVTLIAPVDWV